MSRDRERSKANQIPEWVKKEMEARDKGALPQFYLEKLRILKKDFSNELPEEDVRNLAEVDDSGFVDKFKCKGNYIVGLSTTLQGAIREGIITSPEIKEKIEEFRTYKFHFQSEEGATKEERRANQRTTEDEIKYINATLDLIIKHLEEIKNL